MIGRTGSSGFPGKNVKKVLGKALCEYPLIAASNSKYIDKIFVSTDCPKIKKISKSYNVEIIERPKKLANNKALGDHVYEHGYFEIKKMLNLNEKNIEFIILLMANATTITGKLINKGINILRKNQTLMKIKQLLCKITL